MLGIITPQRFYYRSNSHKFTVNKTYSKVNSKSLRISYLKLIFFFSIFFICNNLKGQVIINEGSNRNYSAIADEDLEYTDWIELYNSGIDTVNLLNYSITDDISLPNKWTLPDIEILPGSYRTVFCSGKNRKPAVNHYEFALSTYDSFKYVIPDILTSALWNTEFFNASSWNSGYGTIGYGDNDDTIALTPPFESVFLRYNMTLTDTGNIDLLAFLFDYDDAFIVYLNGTEISRSSNITDSGWDAFANSTHEASMYQGMTPEIFMPNMQIVRTLWHQGNNVIAIELHNTSTGSSDLSLAVNVLAGIKNAVYSYPPPPAWFLGSSVMTANLHTNFKISGTGESVYLFSPTQQQLSSLYVHCNDLNNSVGCFPDASIDTFFFENGTPGTTNNLSVPFTDYSIAPVFSLPSGFYTNGISISITNPNISTNTAVYYTLNGNDPDSSSFLYNGSPIIINQSTVLKALAYATGLIGSPVSVSSYFMNVNHETPILSVVTDNANLYGGAGIFDNYNQDWEKAAYVEYFDSLQNMIFSQRAGMMIDGGAGGSRSNPQHSFKVKMGDDVLGDGAIDYMVIPDRPNRTKYSTFYLRNGSNQYLTLPYKDAIQVKAMCAESNSYYSAMRPVTVYLNGEYFGLYELRENFDDEYFKIHDDANTDSVEILSLSYFYGSVLRAVQGSVDSFWNSYNSYLAINNADTGYWNDADNIFDMTYYNDYIIGQSWMGNVDWPQNNIKLYRSDATNHRWRFGTIDLELAMGPNSWTDCYYDHIAYLLSQSTANPYINIWLQGLLNDRFRNYFINRFADLMNTSYDFSRISAIENDMYNQFASEMLNEFNRWGTSGNVAQDMVDFSNNHLVFQNQLSQRTEVVRNNIESNFNLPRQVDLTLDVYPAGAGKIHISTITPDSYPWQGVYFDGLPVKIQAIPSPGFHFLHWGNNILLNDTLNIVFNDTLVCDDINFTAWFEEDFNSIPSLSYFENDLSIYPSPATTDLFVVNRKNVILSDCSYQVIDMNGRIILKGKLQKQASTSININALNEALYILEVSNTKGEFKRFRFVKIKAD